MGSGRGAEVGVEVLRCPIRRTTASLSTGSDGLNWCLLALLLLAYFSSRYGSSTPFMHQPLTWVRTNAWLGYTWDKEYNLHNKNPNKQDDM